MAARQRWRSIADRALTIALLVSVSFFGFASYNRWLRPRPPTREPPAPLPLESLSLKGAVTTGSPGAPLALIVYTDFLCPACGQFATVTLPRLLADYVKPGKVLLAMRFISNGTMRPLAYKVAQAGQCAQQQNRFWPVHDDLFKRGPVLSDDQLPMARLEEILLEVARGAGLAEDLFRTCLASHSVRDNVFEDAGGGLFLGVRATPTLFIGRLRDGLYVDVTSREQGALPPEILARLLDGLQASNFNDRGNASRAERRVSQ